jgi:hypothetical protein
MLEGVIKKMAATKVRELKSLGDWMLKLLQLTIDFLLRVDRKRVLNAELDAQTSETDIASEMKTIVDQLKMEAFDTDKGLVNYRKIKGSTTYKHFKKVASTLRHFDPASLQSREEKLAFWINLYNSLIIDAVISFVIEKTAWEAGWGIFRKAAYNIGGLRYSADDIEHGILRRNAPHPLIRLPQFTRDDPRLRHTLVSMEHRIHFTLVCASRSCPLITVYHAAEIEEELEMATNAFINGGIVRPEKGQVSLSRIFSWYQRDFGGRSGVLRFALRYLVDGPQKDYLKENVNKIQVKYQEYDWSLNHFYDGQYMSKLETAYDC